MDPKVVGKTRKLYPKQQRSTQKLSQHEQGTSKKNPYGKNIDFWRRKERIPVYPPDYFGAIFMKKPPKTIQQIILKSIPKKQ